MIVKLQHSVSLGERTITELLFPDKTRVRHLLAGDAFIHGTVGYELAVMSAMTGEPVSLLQEMEYDDWLHVEAMLGSRFKNFYGEGKEDNQLHEGGANNPPQTPGL